MCKYQRPCKKQSAKSSFFLCLLKKSFHFCKVEFLINISCVTLILNFFLSLYVVFFFSKNSFNLLIAETSSINGIFSSIKISRKIFC